jgi:prevent-host-death family protein
MDLTMTDLEAIAGSHSTHPASDVKANWRKIVKEAREADVIVTSYNRPEAVVISVERYAKLKAAARAKDPLQHLRKEFERELAVLRTPGAATKLRQIFETSPETMADVANLTASFDDE